MKRFKFKIWYIIVMWAIIYLLSTAIKYIELRQKLYSKYGEVSSNIRTVFLFNESYVIGLCASICFFPIVLLSGGVNGVSFVYSDFKFNYEDLIKPKLLYANLKASFMEKPFNVTMRNGKIVEDNFYEVLATDPKFNHLYSNWVKKQIGCEDENVELKIGFQKINFENIKSLNKNYDEIFENISNPGYTSIDVKNCKELSEKNFEDIFYSIKDKYSIKNIIDSNNFIMTLMSYDCNFFSEKGYNDISFKREDDIMITVTYWDGKIIGYHQF